ncbi:MAG: DUF5808 domain-containing protein [Actinomycetota bacterium]
MRFLKTLFKLAFIALVIAAIAEELRKPRGQREGFGRVAGLVPYDFRIPTPDRFKDRMWNPNDDRLITETPFGVGWSLNLARLRPRQPDVSWN